MLPALCLNDLMTRAEQGENLNRATGKETKTRDSSRGVGGHWGASVQPRPGLGTEAPKCHNFNFQGFFSKEAIIIESFFKKLHLGQTENFSLISDNTCLKS